MKIKSLIMTWLLLASLPGSGATFSFRSKNKRTEKRSQRVTQCDQQKKRALTKLTSTSVCLAIPRSERSRHQFDFQHRTSKRERRTAVGILNISGLNNSGLRLRRRRQSRRERRKRHVACRTDEHQRKINPRSPNFRTGKHHRS